jgi:hypothetical protein
VVPELVDDRPQAGAVVGDVAAGSRFDDRQRVGLAGEEIGGQDPDGEATGGAACQRDGHAVEGGERTPRQSDDAARHEATRERERAPVSAAGTRRVSGKPNMLGGFREQGRMVDGNRDWNPGSPKKGDEFRGAAVCKTAAPFPFLVADLGRGCEAPVENRRLMR